jgi:hypothetical protein
VDAADAPELEDGPVVAQETVRRITCDSAIVRLIETGAGEPLDLGRKTRVISPALRRAVKRRDRHCRWPACTHRGTGRGITSGIGQMAEPRAWTIS